MNVQDKLEKLYTKCIDELNSINIDVEKNLIIELKINTRSKKRYDAVRKFQKISF